VSLKSFHLIFISLCVLLCWGFGFWCVQVANQLIAAGVSFMVGLVLVTYEVYILKKLKHVSLM